MVPEKVAEAKVLEPDHLDFIVLDLETLRLADEVEGGWGNIEGFGLSVACTWDATDGFRDWYENQVPQLVTCLNEFPAIVGFNILAFDYRVLDPYCSTSVLQSRTVDILSIFKRQTGHRIKLDDLAQATLGHGKSGVGTLAVKWWREGRRDKVVSYCRQDVEITRDIFIYGAHNGCLKYPSFDGIKTAQVSFATR